MNFKAEKIALNVGKGVQFTYLVSVELEPGESESLTRLNLWPNVMIQPDEKYCDLTAMSASGAELKQVTFKDLLDRVTLVDLKKGGTVEREIESLRQHIGRMRALVNGEIEDHAKSPERSEQLTQLRQHIEHAEQKAARKKTRSFLLGLVMRLGVPVMAIGGALTMATSHTPQQMILGIVLEGIAMVTLIGGIILAAKGY